MKAYIRHLRICGLCGPGAKPWFEQQGLDWADFVRNGISIEILEATGDAFALMVAEAVRNGK